MVNPVDEGKVGIGRRIGRSVVFALVGSIGGGIFDTWGITDGEKRKHSSADKSPDNEERAVAIDQHNQVKRSNPVVFAAGVIAHVIAGGIVGGIAGFINGPEDILPGSIVGAILGLLIGIYARKLAIYAAIVALIILLVVLYFASFMGGGFASAIIDRVSPR